MELSKMPWPITTTHGIRDRIDTNPDYQRPAVWSLSQKRLLIDTILRGYDIPKMYWRKTGKNPDKYEVVDGQQRLRAIWEFMDGGFSLDKNAEDVNGYSIANRRYKDDDPTRQIPDDLKIKFDTYSLDVIILLDTDEDEVREMFLRLQNGTSLKAQEKRNAMPGKMREFVKQIAAHSFFKNVGFENSRFNHDLVAAQIIRLELAGQITNIKNADLNKMYEEHADFDKDGPKAKKIKRVLEYMLRVFPEKTPELERYSTVSLYVLCSKIIEQYAHQGIEERVRNWFIGFEQDRRGQSKLDSDTGDPEFITYLEKTNHSTDAADSLQWRNDFLFKTLLLAIPDLKPKDNIRSFTHEQRLAIYRRDSGICQVKMKCDGVKCDWDNWEADHKVSWVKGGATTVENGQVACVECNRSKSGS